jgi:hypothetical protein
VTLNGTGGAVPVTVLAADTDGTAYISFDGSDGTTVVDTAEDELTIGSHTFLTGQKVTYTNGGGSDITGLTDSTDYYVIVVDSTTVQLASSRANALAETAIDLTAAGTGINHLLTEVANTTVQDLVDDINRAINGTSLSGKVRAKASGDQNIIVEASDESIAKFQLTATGTAVTGLKLPASETVARYDGVLIADSMGDKLVVTADAPTAPARTPSGSADTTSSPVERYSTPTAGERASALRAAAWPTAAPTMSSGSAPALSSSLPMKLTPWRGRPSTSRR